MNLNHGRKYAIDMEVMKETRDDTEQDANINKHGVIDALKCLNQTLQVSQTFYTVVSV